MQVQESLPCLKRLCRDNVTLVAYLFIPGMTIGLQTILSACSSFRALTPKHVVERPVCKQASSPIRRSTRLQVLHMIIT
jgi:hypothetical protein